MLDVCICFVSNIHSSFQIQERFVRACDWMCALVALRTDGDGRTIHSAPRTSPASHTHRRSIYVGPWKEAGLQLALCSFASLFSFLSVSSPGLTCGVGRRVKTLDNTQTSDCASPTPRGGENTCTGALPRCKGEARLRGLQICGASAWFSCDFFSSFAFSFFHFFFCFLSEV